MVQRTQEWCTYIFVIVDLTYFFCHVTNVHYKGCLKQKNVSQGLVAAFGNVIEL